VEWSTTIISCSSERRQNKLWKRQSLHLLHCFAFVEILLYSLPMLKSSISFQNVFFMNFSNVAITNIILCNISLCHFENSSVVAMVTTCHAVRQCSPKKYSLKSRISLCRIWERTESNLKRRHVTKTFDEYSQCSYYGLVVFELWLMNILNGYNMDLLSLSYVCRLFSVRVVELWLLLTLFDIIAQWFRVLHDHYSLDI